MYNLCIIGLGNPSPKYDNSRHNIGKDWVINVSKKFFKEFKVFPFNSFALCGCTPSVKHEFFLYLSFRSFTKSNSSKEEQTILK